MIHDLDDSPRCTRCRSLLWDDEMSPRRPACRKCERCSAEQLRAIPDLFRRLDRSAALMKGASLGQIGGPSREIPAPLRLGILSLTAEGGVVTQLQAIEDAWRQALGWSMGEKRHRADIDGAVTFLVNNLPWACDAYGEVADDLRTIASLHGRLAGIDSGEPPARRFAVYCAADHCDGRMTITLWTEHATCPDCHTPYDRDTLTLLDSEYGPNPDRAAA
ncbi:MULTISPECIES: hypothetical protein [Streptomyces]|uniref:hypothetical protein n=1 Tax=Streptomyces TaxID=1883 RepID=UPI0004CD0D3A|nr:MULTISPECIES: hypothetical protein [Streptomyces]KOT49938.1 hypothetical protein ADK43_35060 [Streptomyces rimosus subsp. rimosus]